MLDVNSVLLMIILILLIITLVSILVTIVLRELNKGCLSMVQKKEDISETPVINIDEAKMDYSFEIVQPKIKDPGNERFPHIKQKLPGKPKLQRKLFESIMSNQADSADEMSFIYDGCSEAESEQERRTKAISTRFRKYLDNVPGKEPVILVALHYTIHEENMEIAIIKVANLKPLSNYEKPDPYVRVDVRIENKIILKKKTVVMKEELNPVYNQKMEFHISAKDLENVKILLTIVHFPLSHLSQQGGCRQHQDGSLPSQSVSLHELVFSEQSSGSSLEHWKTAIATNNLIAKWHVLH